MNLNARSNTSGSNHFKLLKEAAQKTFGTGITGNIIVVFARNMNEHIESCRLLGRSVPTFPPKFVVPFVHHPSEEVRTMVANLLPEHMLSRFKMDRSHLVRNAAAKRLPLNELRDMVSRHPDDDMLSFILEERDDEWESTLPHNKYVKDPNEGLVDLSPTWYAETARKIAADYGEPARNIAQSMERSWIPRAAHQFSKMNRVSYGFDIDEVKLRDAIYDVLDTRDEEFATRTPIRESREQRLLGEQVIFDIIEEAHVFAPKSLGGPSFLKEFDDTFNVKYVTIPQATMSTILSEDTQIPMSAHLLHEGAMTFEDEQVFDQYVSKWNKIQEMKDSPLRLQWQPHSQVSEIVLFELEFDK